MTSVAAETKSNLSTTPAEVSNSFLNDSCPPMGIYETLYKFADTFGSFSMFE